MALTQKLLRLPRTETLLMLSTDNAMEHLTLHLLMPRLERSPRGSWGELLAFGHDQHNTERPPGGDSNRMY